MRRRSVWIASAEIAGLILVRGVSLGAFVPSATTDQREAPIGDRIPELVLAFAPR